MPHWYSSEQGKHFLGLKMSGAEKKNQKNVSELMFSESYKAFKVYVFWFLLGYPIIVNGWLSILFISANSTL